MLYGSGPDQLATQQMEYDRLYNSSNENNASRYDAAQARAVENILRQRQADAEAQRFADQEAGRSQDQQTAYDFRANQAALDRTAQFSPYGSRGGNQKFDELVKQIDWLPSDPKQLAAFAPGLPPDQFNQLQLMVQRRDKMIAANQQQQADKQAVIDAPQNKAATEGAALADAGNLYNRAAADTAAIAKNPITPARAWYNPAGWAQPAGIPSDNIIQPSDHANALMATRDRTLAPQITPGAIAAKDSTIQVNPVTGNIEPRYQTTPSFRPPVILPSNPPPVAPPVAPPPIQAAPSPIVPNKTAATLPLPLLPTGKVDGSRLVAGQVYQTKRGLALWDGKQFSQ